MTHVYAFVSVCHPLIWKGVGETHRDGAWMGSGEKAMTEGNILL